jgi:hypothetical protein
MQRIIVTLLLLMAALVLIRKLRAAIHSASGSSTGKSHKLRSFGGCGAGGCGCSKKPDIDAEFTKS